MIGSDGEEHVRRFDSHLIIAEAMVLEDADMVQRAFDQRLGTRLAVLLKQVFFEAAGVDADPDRATVGAGRGNDLLDPVLGADVARIDTQTGRSGICRFEGPFVMEVDVRNDRHVRRADDFLERSGRFLRRARHANDIHAGLFAAADLVDRRLRVLGRRVSHRLHGDGRVATYRHGPNHDLARVAPSDISPRAD